ncbi:MAG: vWA domain-containing protein [Methylococcales bacterium]
MSRRLPIYIAVDTSGSMQGEAIQSVNVGLQSMLHALRQDPHALDTVHLSLITFDLKATERLPLTPLDQVQLPEIRTPKSGATLMGEALALIAERVRRDVIRGSPQRRGDWRPILFLMTDGKTSDSAKFEEMVPIIKKLAFGKIVACAAGPKANTEDLKKLTDTVVSLDTTDSAAFTSFFQWVSASVGIGSSNAGTDGADTLPPPPDEIQFVI